MNDLTEKLKAGELEEGWYYVKLKNEKTLITCYWQDENIDDEFFSDCNYNDVSEVLAPVPEYDQWDRCLKLEASLNRKNRKWGKLVKAIGRINELSVERKKKVSELKKLLKECLPIISAEIMTWQIRGDEESHKKGKELLTKINEVLR